MDETRPDSPKSGPAGGPPPIAEADLHAYADGQLSTVRRAEVEQYLATHEEERLRVDDWQRQTEGLRALLNPVLDEPLPLRLPLRPESVIWPWRALAAGIAICVVSAGAAAARSAAKNPSNSSKPTVCPVPVSVTPGAYAARKSPPMNRPAGPDPDVNAVILSGAVFNDMGRGAS